MKINTPKYTPSNVFKITNGQLDTLSTNFLKLLQRQYDTFASYTITQSAQFRVDLISKDIYDGDASYWWVILYVNDMSNINNLKQGKVVKAPSITDIEKAYKEAREILNA